MIEQTVQGEPDPQSWVKRLAHALEAKVGQNWALAPQPRCPSLPKTPLLRPKAPAYSIWFRPSPSKKIKFKEVAHALLVFTGRTPPAAG